MTPDALEDWRRLASSALFPRELAAGRIVPTELDPQLPARAGYVAALRHERIHFVSYPYEWSFGMLRDAALLHLDLLASALEEDLTLKDATPYNVQWRGAWPVFVDVGSFEPLRPGEPWAGYRQFCTLFLYPLLLQAYAGVPFHARLRGSIDGIPPEEARALLAGKARLRRGVFTHVALHSRLESRYGDRRRDVRLELKEAGFGKQLIQANVRRLAKLVRRLEWEPPRSTWLEYGPTTTYTEADAARKAEFVLKVARQRPRRLLWDLGANDGRYTRIAADHARYAVAIDGEHGVVENLYRTLRDERSDRILPLVVDLADPSPGLGWRGQERRALWDRGRPDLTLALALVHHLAIGRNVPLRELVDWLRDLQTELVVEFVAPEDPMARRLLAGKREGLHEDYSRASFERALGDRFEIARSEELASGTRVLYAATPRT